VTVPFIQLWGSRINLLGALWQLGLILLTYNFLRKIEPFTQYRRNIRFVLANVVGFLIVLAYHQIVDSAFIVLEIFSGHEYMIVGEAENWSWPTFWITILWCFLFMSLIIQWIVKTYKLGKYLKIGATSVLSMLLVVILWDFHLTFFPYDYAVLTGQLRITVFWAVYPELYICYLFLYISLWNNSLVKS